MDRQLYIWENLAQNPVLASLCCAAEAGGDEEERSVHLRSVLPALLDFAQQRALTDRPVQEYILRALLEDENVYSRALPSGCVHSALGVAAALEIDWLRSSLLSVDWAERFGRIGLAAVVRQDGPSALARQHSCAPAFTPSLTALLAAAEASTPALQSAVEAHIARFGAGPYAGYQAYNWKQGALVGIDAPDLVHFDDLLEIDYQKETLIRNTGDFLAGRPANNVLLCGSMGSGKTSCIKALMTAFAEDDLRIVAVQRAELHSLDALLDALARQARRSIVFLDDLSFDEDAAAYSQLKTALDGDLSKPPENVLFYATSNRRNIVRESWNDRAGEEVHTSDAQAEKQSLAERFGIKLFFGRYGQAEYFAMIEHGLAQYGLAFDEEARAQAIEWERNYHARSGRSAANFIRHYAAEHSQQSK